MYPRPPQRPSTWALLVVLAIVVPLAMFLNGALVMVAFALLHRVFAAVPAISFAQAFFVGIALSILGGFFKGARQ